MECIWPTFSLIENELDISTFSRRSCLAFWICFLQLNSVVNFLRQYPQWPHRLKGHMSFDWWELIERSLIGWVIFSDWWYLLSFSLFIRDNMLSIRKHLKRLVRWKILAIFCRKEGCCIDCGWYCQVLPCTIRSFTQASNGWGLLVLARQIAVEHILFWTRSILFTFLVC